MRVRIVVLASFALIAATVMSAQAGASTRIGSDCAVASGADTALAFQTASPTSSYAVPADGVIVNWGTRMTIAPVPETLVVATPLAANQYRIDATAGATLGTGGLNNFAARIPVKQGQVIGNATYVLYCADTGGSLTAESPATSLAVGTTHNTSGTAANTKLSIFADIEADADHDGFGDETQDACPQNAAFQTPCPNPKLGASIAATKRAFKAYVTTDIATTVQATASLTLPSAAVAKKLTFKSKRYKTMPGVLTKVKLVYPTALNRALAKLSRTKSLKLKVTLTADGVVKDTRKIFTVKLRGTK